MVVVPVAALVFAYGYGNGHSIQQNTLDVLKDVADLLGIKYH